MELVLSRAIYLLRIKQASFRAPRKTGIVWLVQLKVIRFLTVFPRSLLHNSIQLRHNGKAPPHLFLPLMFVFANSIEPSTTIKLNILCRVDTITAVTLPKQAVTGADQASITFKQGYSVNLFQRDLFQSSNVPLHAPRYVDENWPNNDVFILAQDNVRDFLRLFCCCFDFALPHSPMEDVVAVPLLNSLDKQAFLFCKPSFQR